MDLSHMFSFPVLLFQVCLFWFETGVPFVARANAEIPTQIKLASSESASQVLSFQN